MSLFRINAKSQKPCYRTIGYRFLCYTETRLRIFSINMKINFNVFSFLFIIYINLLPRVHSVAKYFKAGGTVETIEFYRHCCKGASGNIIRGEGTKSRVFKKLNTWCIFFCFKNDNKISHILLVKILEGTFLPWHPCTAAM